MDKKDIDKIIQKRLCAIEENLKNVSEIISDIQAQKNLVSYLILLKNDIKE